MRIIFIRHGETEGNLHWDTTPWNHDLPLTDNGRLMAASLLPLLEPFRDSRLSLVTSPLSRARETAGIIGEGLGIHPSLSEALLEGSAGERASFSVKDNVDYWQSQPAQSRATFAPPGGDSWEDIGGRVAGLCAGMPDDATVIAVSHEATICCGIGKLLGTEPASWDDLEIPTASLSRLEKTATGWTLVECGIRGTLESSSPRR